jgi:phenylacetate-CoA ligase
MPDTNKRPLMNLRPKFEWTAEPRATWLWDRVALERWQLNQLNRQFNVILPLNQFYREKLGVDQLQLNSLDQLRELPLTTKSELVASLDVTGWSPHQSFPPVEYSRLHRTSGTTGAPMMILDTIDDWQGWWSVTWQHVLEAAEVTPIDRVFLAFSFGPFVGFWSAHQACADRGCTVIPGGGLSSLGRLEFLKQTRATVMLCTPTYALHLAEVAANEGFDLRQLAISRIIVAGETGGSILSVRTRIETAWNARVVDHCGATEVGPWGFGWPDRPGIHVIETSFIAELIPLGDTENSSFPRPASMASSTLACTPCELVLTSLGRYGAPVIRYRTGDVVHPTIPNSGPCRFLWLQGGVQGRTDDMRTIRGVNVFPSSIDAVLREFDSVAEYQVIVSHQTQLDELRIEVEAPPTQLAAIRKRMELSLGLRLEITSVPHGTLPRHEGKAKRWIDQRNR